MGEKGFTYLGLLFFIAISAAALSATATIWSKEYDRQKAQELDWVGNQFQEAIAAYYWKSPGTIKEYPPSLDDLIEDRRYLTMARYLRKIYRDPFTKEAQWDLIPAGNGRIAGVRSVSGRGKDYVFIVPAASPATVR